MAGEGKHGTAGCKSDSEKGTGFYGGPVTKVKPRHLYAWIDRNRGTSSIALCCLALSVRREGFYTWQKRKKCPDSDDKTVSALKAARKAHSDYGVRSLRKELPAGIRPSYGKCCRLCRENGLLHRKRTPRGMTKRNNRDLLSEDLIQRDFKASAPNTKWMSDITEMKCKNLYSSRNYHLRKRVCK